jgi:hypothetical protein
MGSCEHGNEMKWNARVVLNQHITEYHKPIRTFQALITRRSKSKPGYESINAFYNNKLA